MPTFAELLPNKTLVSYEGAVYLGPYEGVCHPKFYIIAGVSGDRVLCCSVLINSNINPYILARKHLLELQIQISPSDYKFLTHESFINCASPHIGQLSHFDGSEYKYIGVLDSAHLSEVRSKIKSSGMLTPEDIDTFFKTE